VFHDSYHGIRRKGTGRSLEDMGRWSGSSDPCGPGLATHTSGHEGGSGTQIIDVKREGRFRMHFNYTACRLFFCDLQLRDSEASRPAALAKLWLTQARLFRIHDHECVFICGCSLAFKYSSPGSRVNPLASRGLASKSATSSPRNELASTRPRTDRPHLLWILRRDVV